MNSMDGDLTVPYSSGVSVRSKVPPFDTQWTT
jgi:hypothetical protein